MTETQWSPEGGHKTKDGCERWRVCRGGRPLEDEKGRPRHFRTGAAAKRIADDLNLGWLPGTPTPTDVERRLMAGAQIMKTCAREAEGGVFWTFTDTGRAARADVVERLIASGRLKPRGDGLFDDSQTWALAA